MAEPVINAKTLEHLAALARLELGKDEEKKLLRDLSNILNYVGELQSVDTSGVVPLSGATGTKNVFREDAERESTNRGAGVENFPNTKDGFLEIPPVFE